MTSQAELDDRYGRTSRGRARAGWIVTGVAAVAAVGLLAWSTVFSTVGTVSYDDLGYHVVDAHSVDVRFQVSGDQRGGVACALEALDEGFAVVGWRVVEFGASEATGRQFTESVPTLGLATTGVVRDCWPL